MLSYILESVFAVNMVVVRLQDNLSYQGVKAGLVREDTDSKLVLHGSGDL